MSGDEFLAVVEVAEDAMDLNERDMADAFERALFPLMDLVSVKTSKTFFLIFRAKLRPYARAEYARSDFRAWRDYTLPLYCEGRLILR